MIKKIVKIFCNIKFILIIKIFFINNIFSSTYVDAFPVFNLPVSIRSAGMGNVSQTVVKGVFNTYSNNGVIGYLDRKEIGFTTMMLYYDTTLNYIGYFHPTIDYGNYAINILNLYSSGAVEVDEYNVETGSTFALSDTLLSLGYGKEVYRQLYGGISAKFINSSLHKYNNQFLLLDFGLLYKPYEKLSFGFSCNNFLSIVMTDTENKPNLKLRTGVGFKPYENFLIGFDMYKNSQNSNTFDTYAIGAETTIFDILSLRIGKNTNEITAGLGIEYKIFTYDIFFDYAFVVHEYLETSHRFSLNLKFGKTLDELWASRMKVETTKTDVEVAEIKLLPDEEKQKSLQNLFDQAIKNYTSGDYRQALVRFTQAKEIDPKAKDIDIYLDRIRLVTSVVERVEPSDKVSSLLLKGINYFINGDNVTAVKTLSYALSLKPEDKNIIRLLTSIEEKTGVRAEKVTLKSGLTLVEQKHNEALTAFNKREYEKVISICEDILLLEPENALAYKRLGSALYALGNITKAVQMWRKALDLDPLDRELKTLLESIK